MANLSDATGVAIIKASTEEDVAREVLSILHKYQHYRGVSDFYTDYALGEEACIYVEGGVELSVPFSGCGMFCFENNLKNFGRWLHEDFQKEILMGGGRSTLDIVRSEEGYLTEQAWQIHFNFVDGDQGDYVRQTCDIVHDENVALQDIVYVEGTCTEVDGSLFNIATSYGFDVMDDLLEYRYCMDDEDEEYQEEIREDILDYIEQSSKQLPFSKQHTFDVYYGESRWMKKLFVENPFHDGDLLKAGY